MTTTNPFDAEDETFALMTYRGRHGRTEHAEVKVLDWTEDGWAMVAHPDGSLVPVFELAGFVCLAGNGVLPGQLPVGTPGAGRARALFNRRSKR